MSSGTTCAVRGCHYNRTKLNEWLKLECFVHQPKTKFECSCQRWYEFHRIPKDADAKRTWLRNLNLKKPPKAVYVCSFHFVDKRPTRENPYPTLLLGERPPEESIVQRHLTGTFSLDDTSPDFAPSIFPRDIKNDWKRFTSKNERWKRKKKRDELKEREKDEATPNNAPLMDAPLMDAPLMDAPLLEGDGHSLCIVVVPERTEADISVPKRILSKKTNHTYSNRRISTNPRLEEEMKTKVADLRQTEIRLKLHAKVLSELYCPNNVIPKELRIQMPPTIGSYNKDFNKKWCDTLDKCSLDLMHLIVEELSRQHEVVSREIFSQEAFMKVAFNGVPAFHDTTFESGLYEEKVTEYKRDVLDYKRSQVYSWMFAEPFSNEQQVNSRPEEIHSPVCRNICMDHNYNGWGDRTACLWPHQHASGLPTIDTVMADMVNIKMEEVEVVVEDSVTMISHPNTNDMEPLDNEEEGDEEDEDWTPNAKRAEECSAGSHDEEDDMEYGRPLSSSETEATPPPPPRKRPSSSVPPEVRKDGVDHSPNLGEMQAFYCISQSNMTTVVKEKNGVLLDMNVIFL